MKVYENQKAGQLVSFEIRNVGRTRACRIVRNLFPSTLVERQGGDEFAAFTLNGKAFVIEEPFGDNSRYLIYQQPPQPSAELEALKAAFQGHHASWFFSGDKSFRVMIAALLLAIIAIIVTVIVLTLR